MQTSACLGDGLAERFEATDPWRVDVSGDQDGVQVTWGCTVRLRLGLPTLYFEAARAALPRVGTGSTPRLSGAQAQGG